jgi:hypothetical protein
MKVYVVISRSTGNIIAVYANYSKAVIEWNIKEYSITEHTVL